MWCFSGLKKKKPFQRVGCLGMTTDNEEFSSCMSENKILQQKIDKNAVRTLLGLVPF